MISKLSAKDYKKTVNKDSLSVVKFYAEWCSACQKYSSMFIAIAKDIGEVACFFEVNIDENPDLSEKLGVEGIPTTLIYQKGKELMRFVGVPYKKEMVEVIKDFLS